MADNEYNFYQSAISGIDVTGWNRKTVADGQYLNSATIQPICLRTSALASGLDVISAAIDSKIAGVYKVMGSEKWENLTATSAKVNGNVYNLSEDPTATSGDFDRHGIRLYKGDNVVYVTAGAAGWDKLGSDVSGMATEDWVKTVFSGSTNIKTVGELSANSISSKGDLIVDTKITAPTAYLTNISSENVTAVNLSSTKVSADSLSATKLSADSASATTLSANELSATTLSANNVTANTASGTSAKFTNISGDKVSATNLSSNNISATNLSATNLSANTISSVNSLSVTSISANTISSVKNLSAENISAENISANSNITANNISAKTNISAGGNISATSNITTNSNIYASAGITAKSSISSNSAVYAPKISGTTGIFENLSGKTFSAGANNNFRIDSNGDVKLVSAAGQDPQSFSAIIKNVNINLSSKSGTNYITKDIEKNEYNIEKITNSAITNEKVLNKTIQSYGDDGGYFVKDFEVSTTDNKLDFTFKVNSVLTNEINGEAKYQANPFKTVIQIKDSSDVIISSKEVKLTDFIGEPFVQTYSLTGLEKNKRYKVNIEEFTSEITELGQRITTVYPNFNCSISVNNQELYIRKLAWQDETYFDIDELHYQLKNCKNPIPVNTLANSSYYNLKNEAQESLTSYSALSAKSAQSAEVWSNSGSYTGTTALNRAGALTANSVSSSGNVTANQIFASTATGTSAKFTNISATNISGNLTGVATKATSASAADMLKGFEAYTADWSWGKIGPNSGYTAVGDWKVNTASKDKNAEIAFAYKDGSLYAQIDGKFYQNEGKDEVLDTTYATSTTSTFSGMAKSANYAENAGQLGGVAADKVTGSANSGAAASAWIETSSKHILTDTNLGLNGNYVSSISGKEIYTAPTITANSGTWANKNYVTGINSTNIASMWNSAESTNNERTLGFIDSNLVNSAVNNKDFASEMVYDNNLTYNTSAKRLTVNNISAQNISGNLTGTATSALSLQDINSTKEIGIAWTNFNGPGDINKIVTVQSDSAYKADDDKRSNILVGMVLSGNKIILKDVYSYKITIANSDYLTTTNTDGSYNEGIYKGYIQWLNSTAATVKFTDSNGSKNPNNYKLVASMSSKVEGTTLYIY